MGDQHYGPSPHIFSFSVRETSFLDVELIDMGRRNKMLEVRKGKIPNSRALGNGGVRFREAALRMTEVGVRSFQECCALRTWERIDWERGGMSK